MSHAIVNLLQAYMVTNLYLLSQDET